MGLTWENIADSPLKLLITFVTTPPPPPTPRKKKNSNPSVHLWKCIFSVFVVVVVVVFFWHKKIIINVKEKEGKTTTSFPGSSRFPPPYWKTRRPWGRGWEKQEDGPRKQYWEERLEARQLLGDFTLIEVVGQIFCSLVEKNDNACRLYQCCLSSY